MAFGSEGQWSSSSTYSWRFLPGCAADPRSYSPYPMVPSRHRHPGLSVPPVTMMTIAPLAGLSGEEAAVEDDTIYWMGDREDTQDELRVEVPTWSPVSKTMG